MKTYLIVYDLRKPGQDYKDLIAALTKMRGDHFQMSAWRLESNASAKEIAQALAKYLDQNDKLIVVEINTANGWIIDPPARPNARS